MAAPNRNVTTAPVGAIGATPNRVLRRLAIAKFRVPGIKGVRRGRRR